MNIPILYESKWLLAVNKPAGLLVEHSPYYPSVEDWALQYVGKEEKKPFVGIIHRLDRPVSGVLLLAKRKAALRDLNEQFRTRTVEKIYLATVESAPPQQRDTITHYLRKDQATKRTIAFDQPTNEAIHCQLTYHLLAQNEAGFVLEIHPHSGKFHQIRAQLSAIGCPIIGDIKYNATKAYQTDAIALHARQLTFVDPFTHEKTTIEAPLADIFQV